jgi:hypothetical protein
VRHIVTPDSTVDFRERVNAVRALQGALTGSEVEAFYQYLLTPSRDEQNQVQENWLRNEMLDKLVQQEVLPPAFPDLLVALYQDRAQDVVMRDYAVQHMAPAYPRASAQQQAGLRGALWQATAETDTTIAGTSLLALLDIAQTDPTADRNRLAETALKLASNDGTGELTRITAIQVCARLGVDQALPVAARLAEEAQSMPLRIAATATLADYGTAEATGLLARLASASDQRLALAAQSALSRIARAQASLAKQVRRTAD